MRHTIEWHTAAPLWDRALADPGPSPARFKEPVLLRFADDGFMDTLQQLLDKNPGKLADYTARPESWREQVVGWVTADHASRNQALKLYQPAQNRFYLVAASLVCRLPGLPERAVDATRDRVSFVVRRLRATGNAIDLNDPGSYREYAWIGNRRQGAWQSLDDAGTLAVDEERLPLFFTGFSLEGHKRRLYAGLVPVAGREVYEAGTAIAPPATDELAADPLGDPRLALFRAQVLNGLDSLANVPAGTDAGEAREILAFVLLDLAEFLQTELNTVWQAIVHGSDQGLGSAERQLFTVLNRTISGSSWQQLLVDADIHRQAILTQDFETLDATLLAAQRNLNASQIAAAATALLANQRLLSQVKAALEALPLPQTGSNQTTPPAPAPAPASSESHYVIRCVYEQPGRCGKIDRAVLSRPTRAFRLASFFDPDAPFRDLQIRMPSDTSIKGLRQFPKGVSVLLSSQLRRQMDRANKAGLGNLIDKSIDGESSLNLGVICSFSIPIITICALILLMIIVQLLNIVFWWLPLFRICLPSRSGS